MKQADIDVEYLDHMGSDLTVVNAARVSFHKEHDTFDHESDRKLIKYLATHNHWSPFAHCSASFRVKAPIFVARQLVKHTVGFSWNEVSRRYVDDEPEFFVPEGWRLRSDNVKQGSSEHFHQHSKFIQDHVMAMSDQALSDYEWLMDQGVCPEQARMILPQNTMTEWIWTGTLYAWARMCQLRMDPHTQKETQVVAKKISRSMESLFPTSWEFLMNIEKKEKPCALLSSTPTY
jgi:thymidylate synthase (FAD)